MIDNHDGSSPRMWGTAEVAVMTVEQLQQLLRSVWNREVSADEAWDEIDGEREAPNEYSKEYWLPLHDEMNRDD